MQKLGPKTKAFFIAVLERFLEAKIPFLVGGGFAMRRHTGLARPARDLDIFVHPSDVHRVLRHFAGLGYHVDLTFPHWLGKIYMNRTYVDVIFSSGNGLVTVDEAWFEHATEDYVFGHRVPICPVEEMIWSKAFVMERERFDGADVNHLILSCGKNLDWSRLLDRFASHRLVLLSHVVLFLFVYPSERGLVPDFVWNDLMSWLEQQRNVPLNGDRVCRGPLLSRAQYLEALERGYPDPRLPPEGALKTKDVAIWTDAAKKESEKVPEQP